jgi:predicted O-methyltransferase YrrM
MVSRGYAADFSDREAELLYLFVRHFQPTTVVEMSPCHGYSTNYILAALTHNGKGNLFSYEIMEEVRGVPIAKVIESNLAASVERTRLNLVIGDAMRADMPDYDFLFIDSNHEAWFAAAYFSKLVSTPAVVFSHDILIRPRISDPVMPKGTFLGIREQYYALQTLHANNKRLFSVADFANQMNDQLKSKIPCRYGTETTDRSVIFSGHPQSTGANEMHRSMRLINEAVRNLFNTGDRLSTLEIYRKLVGESTCTFTKLQASSILPLMGYRHPTHRQMFDEIPINWDGLTVSELVAALDLALSSFQADLFYQVLKYARRSQISPRLLAYLRKNYHKIRNGHARRAGRIVSRLLSWGR